MQTSRTQFQSTFDCGCHDSAFGNSNTCEKHQRSWSYYIQSLDGIQVSHVWKYYQKIANKEIEVE